MLGNNKKIKKIKDITSLPDNFKYLSNLLEESKSNANLNKTKLDDFYNFFMNDKCCKEF